MSDAVTEDRIAALVDAAREGRLEDEAHTPRPRRAPVVRRMSFTRPTKFTPDQQRRLRRSHETFCRKAGVRLAGQLRVPVDLELISLAQHTWANAHAELPETSVCAVLEAGGPASRLLLSSELGFALTGIELMLGGSPEAPPRERRLSDIDWALARHLFAQLVEDLSQIWQDFAGVDLTLSAFESQADAAELSLVSEPTLAITMEARIAHASSTLTLLLPHGSIEPFAERLSSAGPDAGGETPAARERMAEALREVHLEVRAELGAVDLPLARVAALRPGDLIEFDSGPADGVVLFAGASCVGRAQPGQSTGRRAVQLGGGLP